MTNMKYLLIALMCLLNSMAHASSGALPFGPIFENYLTHKIPSKVPGYAVAIVSNDEVYKITSGVREKGKPELFDQNTVFRLASVSKTFTPSALLALRNSNVGLDTQLNTFLPNLALSNTAYQKKINIGYLLSQSSGLTPHAYTNLIQDNVPYRRIVDRLKDVNFICEPGSCYSYQNIVYNLAGDVIAQAEKSTYEKIVEKVLFEPLMMNRSSFGFESFIQETNRASPHKWDSQIKNWKPTQTKRNYYQLSSSAGVNSNLNDMVKWLKVQLGQSPSVLNEDELSAMHTPQIKTSRQLAHYKKKSWEGVSNPAYAYGWRTFDFKGQAGFVHHGGWVNGFRVELVVNRQLGVGLFFVTNSEHKVASDIIPEFITMYLEHINKI